MRRAIWLAVPVLLVAAIVVFLATNRPLDDLSAGAPPVEELAVEAVRLEPGHIEVTVRADGSAPVAIAQVQVDGGYRLFTQTPAGPLGRLASATLDIPYPWVAGEAHHLLLLTSTGAAFTHTIEVAQATPEIGGTQLGLLILVGALLGFAPVAAGLLSYPAIRQLGPSAVTFLLALTVGLLVFLLIDTFGEGLEVGATALGRLNGQMLVWVSAGVTVLGLLLLGRRGGAAPEGVRLAFFIALGIGLHNFGEGLVVGAALATGAAALATFLVIGFVIHNLTEGIGIAAPLATGKRPSLAAFAGLAALAGLPAIVGVLAGSQATNPTLVALSFGIGAGAILQVIIEVTALLVRRGGAGALTSVAGAGGIAAGLVVMYGTALLV